MKTNVFAMILGTASLLLGACSQEKNNPTVRPDQPVVDLNWSFETTPVWQDEFSTDGAPDPAKWSFETGGGGWGNNELQYYTSGANASVSGGNLVITARKQVIGGNQYSSARMITKGKGDWLYGRFEIRAKLPRGRGTWPALWMLSTDNTYGTWPASGEMDMMEHVGFDPNKVHCSIHTSSYNHLRGTQKTASTTVAGATDDFHVYRIDWTPYAVRGFVDGTQYFEFVNENTGFTTWPFNKKFYLLMNIAVGGNWGGAQGVDDTAFPATLMVDYVKVYKMIQ